MNKKLVTLLLAAGIAVIFVATGLQAGTSPDTITMDYNKYEKRSKKPPKSEFVVFTHKKHIEDYNISCGDCHHDKDNKPLALKDGDAVQKCAECHTKMAKADKKDKDIMVLENAMHGNCVDCHKALKKKDKDKYAKIPTSCTKCHIKAKK